MLDLVTAGPVILRSSHESHLTPLKSAMEQSITELAMWMDWAADGVPASESIRNMLQDSRVNFERNVGWQYSMFDSTCDELVGACGLHRTDTDERAEINYWVRSDRTGRGYATVAARCLTSVGFAQLPELQAVQMKMDCGNIASAKIPEKLGYRLVGTESHEVRAAGHTGRRYVWSIGRKDWHDSGPSQG